MTWNKKYADRLLKVADHLEHGNRFNKKFNFGEIVEEFIFEGNKLSCGTAGCAIGELPIIFPKHFGYNPDGWSLRTDMVFYKKNPNALNRIESLQKFFHITFDEVYHLFYPNYQLYGKKLYHKAKKETVAKHIRKFVEKKLAEEI